MGGDGIHQWSWRVRPGVLSESCCVPLPSPPHPGALHGPQQGSNQAGLLHQAVLESSASCLAPKGLKDRLRLPVFQGICLDKKGAASDSLKAKIVGEQAFISLGQEEHGRLSHLSKGEARFHWSKGQCFYR